MTYITTGLNQGGRTPHYQIEYDDSLSQADGLDRAKDLQGKCEEDFTLMQNWFGGIDLAFKYPIPVQIANAEGGATWRNVAAILRPFVGSPVVTLKPGNGTSVDFLRYLLVLEISEMFMLAQGAGWFEKTDDVHAADEGSKGEGLSRFLGVQFQLANGLGGDIPFEYLVAYLWLNGGRQDFVNVNPDDRNPDAITGCTTLFLYYLHDQLGFSIKSIIAAGASSLAGVYKNLTGNADGWTSFKTLIDRHYPPDRAYVPPGDNIFPVSELSAFSPSITITCGYRADTYVFLDHPATVELVIKLSSDDQIVTLADSVTVPAGASSVQVTVQTQKIPIPFPHKSINVHATYAGKTLTNTVTVVPPRLTAITLSPDTVVRGEDSTGAVTINVPSLLGNVDVDLLCNSPGFAKVPNQAPVHQNQWVKTFRITTPEIEVPFKTAHAVIHANYDGTSVSATLTVKPKVIAGILRSLTLFPSTVKGGVTSNGTVTLEEPVPTDTLVALAAVETGGVLPDPNNASSVVSVPDSVTIPAEQTSAGFFITTEHLPPHSKRTATIIAGAMSWTPKMRQ